MTIQRAGGNPPACLPLTARFLICNRYRMTAKQTELAARYGIASPYPEDLIVPALPIMFMPA